eukprot:CAMPEP_0198274328 /NCGR_PEP_ID=MMETSP1447-20131203/59995_1 /TAXON_ID=420782 /ORGANISM="Chaetoceros dichaeta, Strain CCMP1751" /LENGTH=91 /DNA_ID=CAMNT_0043968429 /DNA_START=33 /DNA_END=305 /DNA_ORIENTATION=-
MTNNSITGNNEITNQTQDEIDPTANNDKTHNVAIGDSNVNASITPTSSSQQHQPPTGTGTTPITEKSLQHLSVTTRDALIRLTTDRLAQLD